MTLLRVLVVLSFILLVRVSFAGEFGRDVSRDSVALNGTWDVLLERENDEMWKPDVAAAGKWTPVSVPGSLVPEADKQLREGTRFVWARRTFTVEPGHAAKSAVLRWNGVRFGATAWLNGRKLCEHAAVGPNTVMIPAGVMKAGENVLLFRVPGWAGVAKSKSGFPLMPTGAATQTWGAKQPAIYYDVWLEFYDRAYMKWVLAIPDVKAGTVTFRVWLDGAGGMPEKVSITAAVTPANAKQVVVGKGAGKVANGKSPVDVTVPIENAKPWTLDERNLYEVTLKAEAENRACDAVSFRFGLKELRVENGHYTLNGNPFRFRGSNLVNEWNWGGLDNKFNQNIKRYIVDEARAMNLNSFRTHTSPPPHLWLNVCDEEGTFILAEFPILYNYSNFRFTAEEKEVFHANALVDATGWVTTLWNHPSVAIWVLSNESNGDDRWEAGPLHDLVVSLDPTRPTLRTGVPVGTKETVDIHTCGNVSRDSEGTCMVTFEREAAKKDPKRTLGNSEYMNTFGKHSERWLGRADHPDYPLCYAEFCEEHTEAMRRLNFDLVLPYMYAGWTGLRSDASWRPDYPTTMAAALHSCMAPVLASIDLYDRDFAAGREMSTRLVLINEKLTDVPAKLDLYLTPVHPQFVPDADALKAATWHETRSVTFKAAGMSDDTFKWKVPEKEGVYYLAAVVTRDGDRPVVSQREIHAVSTAGLDRALAGRKVRVIAGDAAAEKWLTSRGATVTDQAPDVVVVWDASSVTDEQKKLAPALVDFVKSGGRLVVLEPKTWDWTDLLDFKLGKGMSSRAFPCPNVQHRMLAGINPDFLKRWNGLPNAIADRTIEGAALANGTKLLWMEDPGKVVAVSLAVDKGEVLVTALKLKERLAKDSKPYDPVAERMMVNLLGK